MDEPLELQKFLIKPISTICDCLYRLISPLNVRFLKLGFQFDQVDYLRTALLRIAGAKVGSKSIIRARVFVANASNLSIGERSRIGEFSRLYTFDKVKIGSDVEIGNGLLLYTNEHLIDRSDAIAKQGSISKPVRISNDCYIGANVTILGGVIIGERCIVGSCSLVNKSLEGGYVYAGVPAKKVRKLEN